MQRTSRWKVLLKHKTRLVVVKQITLYSDHNIVVKNNHMNKNMNKLKHYGIRTIKYKTKLNLIKDLIRSVNRSIHPSKSNLKALNLYFQMMSL
jgi:hypothetical protein